MSSSAGTGEISIFIILVILCIYTVMLVILDRCEITDMHLKFISCDTHEWSF